MTGLQILNKYRRIVSCNSRPEGMSEEEFDNIRELVMLVDGGWYDTPVPARRLTPALKYAHEHGLHVEAVPDKETLDLFCNFRARCDAHAPAG